MQKRVWFSSLTLFIMIVAAIIVFVWPRFSLADDKVDHDYPRIMAIELNTGKANAQELARYDVVLLSMNAHNTNPELLRDLRRLNPNIVLLAYSSAVEYPKYRLNSVEPEGRGVWHSLGQGLQPQWFLKTTSGKEASIWPQHVLMNLNAKSNSGQTYADYLANFLYQNVLQTGYWDGLLFDTTFNTISWSDATIDVDADGRTDSVTKIDQAWFNGQDLFLRKLRQLAGTRYEIITNGEGSFNHVNSGRMFEGFPELYEGGWQGSMQKYFTTDQSGYGSARFNIINSDTDNTGNFTDYPRVRFGLTSALLANGYYNFDFGPADRSKVVYYDEYNVTLGRPTSSAFDILSSASALSGSVVPGIWRRDFENGIVLVNSSSRTRTYQLANEYEKIFGRQDPVTNNGQTVQKITIQPNDGIILLRPLEEVLGNVYKNGSFVRVFTSDAQRIRSSFFSTDDRFNGSQPILKDDIDSDGRLDSLVADASAISVYNDSGALKYKFYPYGTSYGSGINFTIGDLNNDGYKEIITGTEIGGGPQIRIFNNQGKLINPGFFAYETNFRGGVHVAVGDLNGDGTQEIIAGAGYGGGPQVRIFNDRGKLINPGFFAYNPSFRGGVYVATGDVNGDGIKEVITGAGPTGGPHVRVWTKDGKMLSEFFGFTSKSNQGVQVGAYDFDGDHRDEIVTMTTDFFILGR